MKITTLFAILGLACLINTSCHNKNQSKPAIKNKAILKVPSEFPSIVKAVENCEDGDWIILAPGTYNEKEIEINKAITISSEWKLTGKESKIDETIIDSDDKKLFIISADGVEISGLKIINGNHTLDILANVSIIHNHFIDNLDAISFEEGSGGYVGYNFAENDRDDAIDIDLVVDGNKIKSEILVEHNTIMNCNDDGIEIRLFDQPNQNIKYTIRENSFIGSNNAGIQLISYDKFTGKEFFIHHNIFRGCKTALGCMEGARTREDLSGASKMDEQVCFYNNTIIGNEMGATGGNNIIAFNNIVEGNTLGGFKRFGANSVIINNLFYQNGVDNFIELNNAVIKNGNIFSDPFIDKNTLDLAANSPCIDAGKDKYEFNGIAIFEIAPNHFVGSAPDIGAIEYDANNKSAFLKKQLIVDAGEDMILVSPESELVLKGKLRDDSERAYSSSWNLKKGPGKVEIVTPVEMETKVVFDQEGIYQFSLMCYEGEVVALDNITVRYINDGEGKQLFLKEENNNFIETEEYAYSYGNVSVISDLEASGEKCILLDAENSGSFATLEFSVGTLENQDYFIWLLVKNETSKKSSFYINFNNIESRELTVQKNKKWEWIAVPGKIPITAGQWPVLIRNEVGLLLIDKILFSIDEKFDPKQSK